MNTISDRIDMVKLNELLKGKLVRHLPEAGKFATAIPGLSIARHDEGDCLENCFYKPLMGLIVQGRKRSLIGAEEHSYGEGQCLIVGVDVPSAFYVTDVSPERPFLAVSISLDKNVFVELLAEVPPLREQDERKDDSGRGVSVADVDPEVLDAFSRLVDLLDNAQQISVLAPMIIREIHYRLLMGPQGGFMRALHTAGSQGNQIANAVAWMRANYREPLQVDQLARQVNMATSTFHHHFKKVTSLSPLQFYKRLRLYEAKRLMLEEHENAGRASLAVGYESQTQFSREYKQVFGESPARDVKRLQYL